MKDSKIDSLLELIRKKAEGVDINELSKKTGCAIPTIESALSGKSNTQSKTISKLISALGITEEEINNILWQKKS